MLYRISRYIPALLWMALIYRASSTPGLKSLPLVQRVGLLPTDLSPAVAQGLELVLRKSAHLASYGILALLLAWALGAEMERRRRAQVAFLLTLLYAISDEWHQSTVPDRSGRWYDVLIDGIGAAVSLLLWSRRPKNPHR